MKLIELVFCLGILAIILLGGSATNLSLLERYQSEQCVSQLISAFALARSEAVKSNQTLHVCGTEDFQSCSLNWSKGYKIFTSRGEILYQGQFKTSPASPIISSAHQKEILYNSEGRSLTRATLLITSKNKTQNSVNHQIVIYDSGRVRVFQY